MPTPPPQDQQQTEIDPYTEIYRAVRGIIIAVPGLIGPPGTIKQGLIQPGNFPDLSQPLPKSDKANSAPDLALLPTDDEYNPIGRNALVTSLVQSYSIATSTNTHSTAELNAIKWLIMKGLTAAPRNLGVSYVTGWKGGNGRDVRIGGIVNGQAVERQWRSFAGITVYADISRAAVLGQA